MARCIGTALRLSLLLALVAMGSGVGGSPFAQSGAGTFKVAFWNIQSGKGERSLPGRSCAFTENGNCTDASLPLNAWGMHVVQDALIAAVRNDPAVIALGLAEAWGCATPAAVQQVLGWKTRSAAKGGVALIAKHGFAGAEEWIQLDTSKNANPSDAKFAVRAPVCMDAACTHTLTVYATHLFAYLPTDDAVVYATYATQAGQILDFAERASATAPHLVVGDFNMFEGTAIVCGDKPKNDGIEMFRWAGYVDAWPAVHGTADGSTGMWNRPGCGVPEGDLWKRVDYVWAQRVNPVAISRFAMVEPGQCAPSDHAGVIGQYALEDPTAPVPAVVIDTPAHNASVAGHIWLSARVANQVAVQRLEWLLDGRVIGVQTAGAFVFDWDAGEVANGPHVLQAAVTSASGQRGVSAPRGVTVFNRGGPGEEVVLYASDASISGTGWTLVTDATAADGLRLQNANAGIAATAARATPSGHAELTFAANAATPYRLWIRGKAIGNSPDNDSVFVQFNDAVNASGAAVFRIGGTAATAVNVEDCSGCGLSGWGWQDNESGRDVLGPPIYFSTSGSHRLRIQAKEDGLGIDQIVLSAVAYRFGPPGALKNDTFIVPPPGTANHAPAIQLTAPPSGTTVRVPVTVTLSATASDPDDAVARVEFFAGNALLGQDTSAPYTSAWTPAAAGNYVLTARATDTRGASTTSAGVSVTVLPVTTPTAGEIVLRVAAQASIRGGWTVVPDATAAGGARLQNSNLGAAKLAAPLASPTQAFDVTFTADAGKPYRLWIRGKAENNHYNNDSVFVQFDRSVTATGTAQWRMDTTSATIVVIEDCAGCGLQEWGWNDNAYGAGALGPLVYFASSGPQRLRLQVREDGIGLDQIVLSPAAYLSAAPGAAKNDATILPIGTPSPSAIDEVVLRVAGQAAILGGWTAVIDQSAAGGARLQNPNLGAAKLTLPLASPAKAFDLTFAADAGKGYRLWIRGKAENNHYNNDSVFVQFGGSVTAAGTAQWRIGTTGATTVVIEDCSGCGLQGWGWNDNAYGAGALGPLVYFASTGTQRLRVQVREDGVGLDQIVLSAAKYLTARPGATKNDITIVPPATIPNP